MSIKSNFPNIQLQSPLTPYRNLTIFQRRALQIREFRVWRRRRIKSNRTVRVRSHLGPSPFEHLFQTLISQFPSINSLDIIAPVLGIASGVALYLTRLKSNRDSGKKSDIGEWILFTSPTPFNRFVMLRCPSISFEGSESLEDVSVKLVKEHIHFVRLNSGRIQARNRENGDDVMLEEKLVYQRVCVTTDDGGVVSLDWPANLDLAEEHGLDTTLLLIPGTVEGSMDNNIRSFVWQSFKRGCFPVVMNPRGCAGSPLTTARLFTAADSNDISTAIQYINKARPWTTLMGVGWGFGANMLTKYLAEIGERTPLTAATCIDNPFDLEEATRSSPYHSAVGQKLTGGLIDILRSNKELFQGRAEGFDFEKALLATSVRDFEKAISMVSYGFGTIEEFYAKSSTRGVVGHVKIPVIFIQNDDGTVPLFSIPRSLIAENPFTSLLLCSCFPSSNVTNGRSTMSWCQHVTLEWLAAVELGLLKGRHPLLNDVDITINPSKGLALVEGTPSNRSDKFNKLLNLPHFNDPLKEMLDVSEAAASIHSKPGRDSQRNFELEDKGLQQENNDALHHTSSVNAELVKEEGVSPVDSERGQMIWTAQVVMNMLDVTMPDTLVEEQKKKVLTAVGQGETLIKALQDAVPEDVREKLTTAVFGILHNQGSNLKVDRVLSIGQIRSVASELKSRIQEKVGLSSAAGNEDPHSYDQGKRVNDVGSDKNQSSTEKTSESLQEHQVSDNSQKSIDTSQLQTSGSHGSDYSGSGNKGTNGLRNNIENEDFSAEKVAQSFEYKEDGSEAGTKPDSSSRSEWVGSTEDVIIDQYKVEYDGEMAHSDTKDYKTNDQDEEKVADSFTDQNQISSTTTEVTLSPQASSLDTQLMEKEGSDNQIREEKSMQPALNQNTCNPPTFSVSQALDALTGIDDSTQVAVNSVFHVIEDMLTQLEVENDDEDKVKQRNKVEYQKVDSVSENKKDVSLPSNDSGGLPSYSQVDSENDLRARRVEKKSVQSPKFFSRNSIEGNGKKEHLVGSELLAENSDKYTSNILHRIPLYRTRNPYGDPLYKEYLQKHLTSKMMNTKPLDIDKTTALFLDYFPEEGQWKLLEQNEHNKDSGDVATHRHVDRKVRVGLSSKAENTDKIIETSYVILDDEKQEGPLEDYEITNKMNETVEICDDTSQESMLFVKDIILDCLRIEISRRLSADDIEEMQPNLARDVEHVVNAVSVAVVHGVEHRLYLEGTDHVSEEVRTLHGEHIVRAITNAVQEANCLRRVLPVGVIVGSSLAALRKFFNVVAVNGNGEAESLTLQASNSADQNRVQVGETNTDEMSSHNIDQKCGGKPESEKLNNETVMVGAVTAALGASALLLHQQDSNKGTVTALTSSKSFKEKENYQEQPVKLEEEISEKSIVTSLAEKAMSVAGPVVPTKEDGEVDQERLVAILAELGQKGGILKLVGKIALLWGGIRGAMSLTDKLISFLRIAERPLFQRILGFICLVLVLWSPVVFPLLPILLQSWVTHSSSRIAEFTCTIGLYTSVMIMVVLWGKRIRGYENSFEMYGLDLTSLPKIKKFLKGLIGGVMLVLLIQSVNALLGLVHLSWSSFPSTSLDVVTWIKVYGRMLILIGQGLVTAIGVALVEELLFRSWLPDEIATDLGYNRGIIISGFAFSLSQRLPWAVPGLWLISLVLSGAKQRSQGSLSLPIGLHAGILFSSFILQKGGLLTYQPNFPLWVTGSHPFQPFSGIVGLAFSLLLAIILYPRQPIGRKKIAKTFRR